MLKSNANDEEKKKERNKKLTDYKGIITPMGLW
jgi:hypothetical protein